MRLRIRFSKTGPMRYISHLDLMRFFQKVLRRADADVTFSEGFSPHMLMSFALPLSLGMESVGEYFDVEVNSCSSTKTLMDEMNRQMCPGCEVLSVKSIPQDKANKCMTQVAAADYSVFVSKAENVHSLDEADECQEYDAGAGLDAGRETDASAGLDTGFLREKTAEFLAQSEIIILKKTKKGEAETDIRPYIYSFEYKGNCFKMRLGAGSVNHVRCDSVMSEFFRFAGISEDDLRAEIRRDDLLLETSDGFASLESIGEEIL